MKSRLFSSQEKKDLAELLSKTFNPDEAFNLEELHGFLFGLAITPDLIKPSEWLPVVFGEELLSDEYPFQCPFFKKGNTAQEFV